MQGIVATMVGSLTASAEDVTNIYKVGQNTTRLLLACGDLVVAWLLLRQAGGRPGGAGRRRHRPGRARSTQGKVAAARFFAAQVLPLLTAQRAVAESVDNALMDVPEDAF